MKNTDQQKFWQSKFGQDYTERNDYSPEQLDEFYKKTYGVSRSDMNLIFLKNLEIEKILEVGCNIGNQLRLLQKQGYKNLYGIEIQKYAVEKAKQKTNNVNIIQGSAFGIPFTDNYFDLVFTAGVLIHISPKDLPEALKEIYRVSKKYIWGFEYFSDKHESINYRGNENCLWKGDFVQLYLDAFPDLKIIKREKYQYLDNNNIDEMFLLEK